MRTDQKRAEHLNRLWDEVVASVPRSHAIDDDDHDRLAVVEWLTARVPPVAMPSAPFTGVPRAEPGTSGGSRRIGTSPLVGRWAAAAALVLIAVAVVIVGSIQPQVFDSLDRQLAALPGLDDDRPSNSYGGGSLMSVVVEPSNMTSQTQTVGLWRATVPAGSRLDIPVEIQELGREVVAFDIEEGSVVIGADGNEQVVSRDRGWENPGADDPSFQYFRGSSPVSTVLFLMPMTSGGDFPLAWASDGGSTPAPAASLLPRLLAQATVRAEDSHAFRVTVLALAEPPNTDISIGAGPEGSRFDIHAVHVESGELTVIERDGGSGSMEQVYEEGETWQASRPPGGDVSFRSSSDQDLDILALTTMPWAENPTLDQTVESVAPFFGEWSMPFDAQATMSVRRIDVAAGSSYSLPTGASVIYHVLTGSGQVTVGDSSKRTAVPEGATIAQSPGAVLTIHADAGAPLTVVQTIVSDAPLDALLRNQVATGDLETQELESQPVSLPAGNVSVMVEVHHYNGVNDGASSAHGDPGSTLIVPLAGTLTVQRQGGDVTIVPHGDGTPEAAALGDTIDVGGDGYALAHPGSGWGLTGATGQPSSALVLSVSPGDASAVATPSTDTIEIVGDPRGCGIAPLTAADIERVTSTPSLDTGTPLDRGLRGATGGIADPDTSAGVTETVRGFVDCLSSGAYPAAYAWFSDEALRESESMRDLVAMDHDPGLGPALALVEDVLLFPDGRASARVVINGESAVLTLVLVDGRWLIDVWDDSGSITPDPATPVH